MYRAFYLLSSVIETLWDAYLTLRQYKKVSSNDFPRELKGVISTEVFKKSVVYNSDKLRFGLFTSLIEFFFGVSVTYWLMPYIWRYSGLISSNESIRTVVWIILLSNVDKILSIPKGLYFDFVIEHRHGFNKKDIRTFFYDTLKSDCVEYIMIAVTVPLIIAVAKWSGPNFYIYVWIISQVLIIGLMYIFPVIIQPLFNKFTPLEDGELRQEIEEMAKKHKFPLKKIFQIDGSKRSAHSNAYFYGVGSNKRIVLYDTLLSLKREEILGVLCHEIGHWYHNHIYQQLLIISVNIFMMFYTYSCFMGTEILASFDMLDSISGGIFDKTENIVMGIIIFKKISIPVDAIIHLGVTLLTRRNEFQADKFAVDSNRGDHLVSALKRLQTDNLGVMNPDPIYSWYHYSHPPLLERIRAITNNIKGDAERKCS